MDHSQKMIDTCKDLLSELNESIEGNQKAYEKYAHLYDDIMVHTDYALPKKVSELCLSLMTKNCESSLILDVAVGTGLASQALRNAGYKGIIDGIDGSKKMIEACENAQIFRNMKVEMLSEDRPLPYPNNTYDAVICVGSLSLGHVPHGCLKDMIRILRSHGILIFNAVKLPNDPDNKVLTSLDDTMSKLVDEGNCTLVKKINDASVTTHDEEITVANCTYFCYKKV